MGNLTPPQITYSASGDLLSIWSQDQGPAQGTAQIVTMRPGISSFYTPAGQCIGIYWYDAGRIILPLLERDDPSEAAKYPELLVDYQRKSDALHFGNRQPAVSRRQIAPGLTAHLAPNGLAQKFTLENVSNILLSRLRRPNWS